MHISFVRSIAMDSWSDAQLAIMKTGGNDKMHEFFNKHGIGPRTPIREKYNHPAAQLYKQVLKARVEGKPEPTELPKPAPSASTATVTAAGGDPNGMERLLGETDAEYVARQTRLREEARARMAAKFGSGGLGSTPMASSSRMAGIGSDPSYNPNSGYGLSDTGLDSLVSGFGSALSTVKSSVGSMMQEEQIQSLKAKGGSFWGQFASSVSNVASSITQPEASDGLADLQREISQQKPRNSLYQGFGSDTYGGAPGNGDLGSTSPFGSNSPSRESSSGSLQEATGLPGEDRNGVERLTGESDNQYVMRQTRLREEARARMAAKFGNGGLGSGVGSGSSTGGMGGGGGLRSAPLPAPSSGNAIFGGGSASTPTSAGIRSAPVSGNAPRSLTPPKTQLNSNDFFSSFGA